MGILGLFMECQPHHKKDMVEFDMFCILSALSERIVALDSTVTRCLNKMDFVALKTKLQRARDLFFVNDPTGSVCMSGCMYADVCTNNKDSILYLLSCILCVHVSTFPCLLRGVLRFAFYIAILGHSILVTYRVI